MERLIACIFLFLFVVTGLSLVWHTNANDNRLIKACQHSPACVNPFTSQGLIE